MSDEFLGVIIENAQNDIRKAGPGVVLPSLAAMSARLGQAIAARKKSSFLASPKLDAAAIAATPIVGPMAPGALAALRAGEAARLRGQAKVAGGRAEAARRHMREAAEEASKESMATTDLRTRAGINVKANQPTETAFTPTLGDYGSPEKIGEQLRDQTSAAAVYQGQADDLTQASNRMAARAAGLGGTAVGVRAARGSINNQNTSMNRIDEQTRRLGDKERGTSSASTTSGFGNMSSPTPGVQGY
jgi:hypothetical protein